MAIKLDVHGIWSFVLVLNSMLLFLISLRFSTENVIPVGIWLLSASLLLFGVLLNARESIENHESASETS
jgi:hypothetical protein